MSTPNLHLKPKENLVKEICKRLNKNEMLEVFLYFDVIFFMKNYPQNTNFFISFIFREIIAQKNEFPEDSCFLKRFSTKTMENS